MQSLLYLHSLCRRASLLYWGRGVASAAAPPLLSAEAARGAAQLRVWWGQADDKEAALRKEARDARLRAAELSDQARRLRALAQKGVNNVLEAAEEPSSI
jgi:hypothetical protein